MRVIKSLALPLLAALMLAPRVAPAQVSVTIRLGDPVVVMNYSPEYYGDWHRYYIEWTPVTVYYFEGRYYQRAVKGGRRVMIYRRGGEYFLPPQDPAWVNRGDKRFNYKYRPVDDDYRHAPPPKGKHGRGRGRGN